MRPLRLLAVTSAVALLALRAPAQGPGSCGVHLDLDANLTSTHSAIADMPGAVGGFPAPIPPAPGFGNPYLAWAAPGTVVTAKVSVPGSALGGAPFGPGSMIILFFNIGSPDVPFPIFATFPPMLPDCAGTGFVIASVLGPGVGVVVSPFPFADPGHPLKFSLPFLYPLPAIFGPVKVQALIITPGGAPAASNGVSLLPGPNPAEASMLAALVPSGASPVLDEGQAIGVPTPPAFMFYGVPTPACDIDTNVFLDFGPVCAGAAPPCGGADFSGSSTDLCGAGAFVRPRVEVNHGDNNWAVLPPAPLVADITTEFAPPGPGWPARLIVRWKNGMPFGAPPGTTAYGSSVCELWDDSRIVVVRQRQSIFTTHNDQIGIGPGTALQGYGANAAAAPTCSLGIGGIDFAATTFGFAPFVGGPLGVIHQDAALSSLNLGNLATVFTPTPGPAYLLNVY